MKIKYIVIIGLLTLFSCEEDFLDQYPKDQLVIQTAFTSYENIQTYTWGFYDAFPGYDQSGPNSEFNADFGVNNSTDFESNFIRQLITVPTSDGFYSGRYSRIRDINLMLDNLPNANITEKQKLHLQSVGYFFRAYNYFELVSRYGGVKWLEHTLTDNSEELTAPRNSRDEVTDNILANLSFAETNIIPNGDGPNTIGVHAVRALISRFGLFEGTWRKYHNLGDADKYLRESASASQKLMTDFPNLHPNYDEVFNSLSLEGVSGIILRHAYGEGVKAHTQTSRLRQSAGTWSLTKKAADKYLMKDGQTRWTSPMFDGDKDPYDEFRNRDRRMLYTITPPYKVIVSQDLYSFTYTDNPKDREYIDLMNSISDDKHKALPEQNWNAGFLSQVPHFRKFDYGVGYNVDSSGYMLFKYYNNIQNGIQNQDLNDHPTFRMGEVLLNYAEAKYELGEFNQTVANTTINMLRDRGGVAPLTVGSEPQDPTRDGSVPASLWEIRRERAVELMFEGFRFDDLRRWKKLDYTQEQKLGIWVKNADYGNRLNILDGAAEGYVTPVFAPPGNMPDYYYLFPLPSNEIVLNPNMEQNPGWAQQ